MKKHKKNWLYVKYQEEHQAAEEKEEAGRKTGIDKEKIVVKKVSAAGRALEILYEVGTHVLKGVAYLLIMAMLSLAVTVLLNEELRNTVFETIFTIM